jgi:hypothetical protein
LSSTEANEQGPASGNVFGTIRIPDQIVHAARQATASKV